MTEKITSLFINIFRNLDELYIVIIASILIGLLVCFSIYVMLQKYIIDRNMKKKGIISRKDLNKNKVTLKSNTWLNALTKNLNQEYMEYKLIYSGYVFNSISQYVIFKVLFTTIGIFAGIVNFNTLEIDKSILILVVITVLSFFIPDFLIKVSTNSRQKGIENQLPVFLVYFDTYNKAGLLFEDILDTITNVLTGELQKEVIRFNISYSMTKNFEESISEFMKRLGTPDVESIEIKLRQCYYSGIYDDVLTDEKEMIEKKVINDIKKQNKKYELYLAIAMVLLIINIFLLVLYPLMLILQSGMSGVFS